MRKLLEKAAKVDKVLRRSKAFIIKKTNDLFSAGAVVVTNRFGTRRNDEEGRGKIMRRSRNEVRKDLSQKQSRVKKPDVCDSVRD